MGGTVTDQRELVTQSTLPLSYCTIGIYDAVDLQCNFPMHFFSGRCSRRDIAYAAKDTSQGSRLVILHYSPWTHHIMVLDGHIFLL